MSAFAELSKLKLSALVVSTTSAGFLAAGGPISYSTLAACTIGTALCSSSASTFNQIFEQDRDLKMKRTRNRPLPQQLFTTKQAYALACTTGCSGGFTLYQFIEPMNSINHMYIDIDAATTTALLGVGNIALYAGLYTYLKPRSEWNTWVGALVGAIPPMMGWTAAGGHLFDIESILLGSTLFLWQFPHFFALSWMHRVDYARGGFQMVPVNDIHGDRTASLITRYTWYLSTLPMISTIMDVTSSMFAIEGLALNSYALYVAYQFKQERTNQKARKVFLTSLWYLPSFMTLFILHSKTWMDADIDEHLDHDEFYVRSLLKEKIKYIRQKGKEVCLHEVVSFPKDKDNHTSTEDSIPSHNVPIVPQGTSNGANCPIVFGKNKALAAKQSTDRKSVV